jgi:RimJ/RimL family protein N-acetyltransferase
MDGVEAIENIIETISFKSLEKTDLNLIIQWLNSAQVNQWYRIFGKADPSHEDVLRKYLPRIEGKDPTLCYLIFHGLMPIGFIQFYRFNDYPQTKTQFGIADDMAGIDIFLGEEDYLHKGFGSLIIRKFLKKIVFATITATGCIVDPEPNNHIAIRAYEKAGFKHLKTVFNVDENCYAYLMEVSRDDIYPGGQSGFSKA